jgi:large subunit ribosomal protein L25
MKTFQLEGSLREALGKKATKVVRVEESVPCVLYGVAEPIHFVVTAAAVRKLIYTPEIFLVELTIAGKTYKAIMKALQFHPVTDKVLHLDFLEVTADKAIVIAVPVKLEGLAEGVKAGGKLTQEMRTLKVKATYDKIPENLVVDVTELGLGKTIQVGALSFPGLEILSPAMNVVTAVKLTRAAKGAAAKAGK